MAFFIIFIFYFYFFCQPKPQSLLNCSQCRKFKKREGKCSTHSTVCAHSFLFLFSHTLYTERCSLYHSVLSLYICSVCVTVMSVECSVCVCTTHCTPTAFVILPFEALPPNYYKIIIGTNFIS